MASDGEPGLSGQFNIALLIDADNAPARAAQRVFAELARHGKVNIRRAYGNWKSNNLKGWEAILLEHAIQPIQQFDLTKGKNATDIAMTIDAMDLLFTKQLDAFGLVTSDCDFTPLVTRILADGKTVFGFGERKTPDAFVNACSTFLFLDEEDADAPKQKLSGKSLKGDTKLVNLIRDAIIGTCADDGWANLGRVGSHISNHASFDPRNYGYSRLSDLIDAIDLFELRRDANHHFEVRDTRRRGG